MHMSALRSLLAVVLLPLATAAFATDHVVTVGGSSSDGYYENPILMFNPANLTIAAGDTVTFTNVSGPHNVHADDESFRCAEGCDNDGHGGNGAPEDSQWSATVTFANAGTFGYHCDNHQHAGMVGNITVVAAAPAALNLNQHGLTGSWLSPEASGQGFVFELYPDFPAPGGGYLAGGWFTYDAAAPGGRRWFTVQGLVDATSNVASTQIFRSEGGSFAADTATTTEAVGTANFSFDDCSHATLDYHFDDGSVPDGSMPLARGLDNVTCGVGGDNGTAAQNYLLSGAWLDPNADGQGVLLDFNPVDSVFFAAWYTYPPTGADDHGDDQQWYTLQAAVAPDATTLQGVTIFETSGALFDAVATTTTTAVGTADLTFASCASATLSYHFTAGVNAGIDGVLELVRVGPVPPGCSF